MEHFRRDLAFYHSGGLEDSSAIENLSKLFKRCDKKINIGHIEFDFTFPGVEKMNIWKRRAGNMNKENEFTGLQEIVSQSHDRNFSKDFEWPVSSVQVLNSNVVLKVDRTFVCNSFLKDICSNGLKLLNNGSSLRLNVVNCELKRYKPKKPVRQLNQVRVNQVCSALVRLLTSCNHDISPEENASYILKVGCSDQKHLVQQGRDIPIKVGEVTLNEKEHTNINTSFMDVYSKMCDNMLSIATERENNASKTDILLLAKLLAASELQLSFLSKYIDRPVVLHSENGFKKITKSDASFMLYNNARITQLLYSFKRQNEKYGDLLSLESVDFSHLQEPEEWQIVFHFLLPYAELMKSLANLKELTSKESLNKLNKSLGDICGLVLHMSSVYSKYYRRVRVLREGIRDPAMIQTLNARVYLVLAIKTIYEHAFSILDIRAPNVM